MKKKSPLKKIMRRKRFIFNTKYKDTHEDVKNLIDNVLSNSASNNALVEDINWFCGFGCCKGEGNIPIFLKTQLKENFSVKWKKKIT